MADDAGSVVETIELDLNTNFDKVLKRDLNLYNKFVQDISGSARSIESAFNKLGTQVSGSMGSLFKVAKDEILSTLNASRSTMRLLLDSGIQINDKYIASFKKLEQAQGNYVASMKRMYKELSRIKDTDSDAKPKREQQALKIEAAQKFHQGIVDKARNEIFSSLNEDMGEMAAWTSKALVQNAKVGLQAIRETANGVTSSLKMVQSQMGLMDRVPALQALQAQYNEMESQHARTQKAMRDQSKQTQDSEVEMKKATMAYVNQTNEELKRQNKDFLITTVKANKEIKTTFAESEKTVHSLGNTVDGAKEKMNQMATAIKKSISQDVKATNITSGIKAAMDNLVEHAHLAGKGMKDALVQNVAKGNEIEAKLKRDAEALKRFRAEAVELGKTGLINTKGEIAKIDKLLNKYNSFFNEFKQRQKEVRDTFGSDVLIKFDASTEQYDKTRASVNGLIADINNYGDVSASNFKQIDEKLKMLNASYEKMGQRRLKAEQAAERVADAIRQAEVQKRSQTNQKLIAEYDTYINTLKAKFNDLKTILAQPINVDTSTMDEIRNKITAQVNQIKENISQGIKATNITSGIENAMDNLVDYARKAGQGMKDALVNTVAEGNEIENKLKRDAEALKQLRKEAIELGKTGLVNTDRDVAEIDKLLAKYNSFTSEFKKRQKEVQQTFNVDMLKFDGGTTQFEKTRTAVNSLIADIKKYGDVSSTNFLEVQEKLRALENAYVSLGQARLKIEKSVEAINDAIRQAEVQKRSQTNQMLIAEYDKYINALKAKSKNLTDIYSRMDSSKMGEIQAGMKEAHTKILAQANKIQEDVRNAFLKDIGFPKEEFTRIENQFRQLEAHANRLSKRKFFIDKEEINRASVGFGKIQEEARKYELRIRQLQDALKQLEAIQRRGLASPGIQAQAEALRTQITQMRQYTQELNKISTQTHNAITRLNKSASKGILGSAWEGIRTFRWQVAAVIYLFTRAANAAKRMFVNVIEEIQNYRKQVMSIAASVAYQMVGTVEDSYDRAYNYSKQLMLRLEAEAARTILTLEDMIQMTKTFAQAGIIPKTDQDVTRIATIGTAIKALTEDMANAGVQMRQELYAIIAGRQRATDQLAMMFKMQGVDIQKLINDARKEGKSMIEVLAKALEPFEEMNRRLVDEYKVQKEELIKIWNIIKRISGTPVMENIAALIGQLNAALFDKNTQQLTKLGETISKVVGAGLQIMLQLGKTIFDVFVEVYKVMMMIFNAVDKLVSSLVGWRTTISDVNQDLVNTLSMGKIFILLLANISASIRTIGILVNVVYQSFRLLIEGAALLGTALHAISTKQWDLLKQTWQASKNLWNDANSAWSELINIWEINQKIIDDAEKGYDRVADAIRNIKREAMDAKNIFSVPFPNVMDNMSFGKLETEYKNAQKAALRDVEKIEFDYTSSMAEFDEFRDQLQKNEAAYLAMFGRINEAAREFSHEQMKIWMAGGAITVDGQKITLESLERWKLGLEAQREALAKLAKVEKALLDKMHQEKQDYYAKEAQAMRTFKRTYEQLIISLEDRPENRTEKTDRWKALAEEDLKWFIESAEAKGRITREQIAALEKALIDGYANRQKQNFEQTEDEYEALILRIQTGGKKTQTEFQKIDTEMDKIILAIKVWADGTEKQKNDLREMTEEYRKQRKEIEMAKIKSDTRVAQSEGGELAANLLKHASGRVAQRQAEMMSITSKYNVALAAHREKLLEIDSQWKKNGEWIKGDGVEAIKIYRNELVKNFQLVAKDLDILMDKQLRPFFYELQDLGQSWADSFADSLGDVVMDFENAADTMTSLYKGIIKQFLSTSFKHAFTDHIGQGSSNIFEGMKDFFSNQIGGQEKPKIEVPVLDQVASASKSLMDSKQATSVMDSFLLMGTPIPVTVVEGNLGQFDGVVNSLETTNHTIERTANETRNTLENGFGSVANSLSRLMSSGGSDGSAWVGLAKAAVSAYAGYSSGNSIGADGYNSSGYISNDYASLGMADGGVIKEHIVGKGLSSGQTYEFGENSKYGEFEDVVPRGRYNSGVSNSPQFNFNMPVHMNALDTRTGLDFLLQHSDVFENKMIKSMKNNRKIREMVRRAY